MASTMAAAWGDGKTKFKLADFIPKWSKGRRQTAAEQLTLLRGLAARQEGPKRVDHR